jgi:arginyl-tRNA synthetase
LESIITKAKADFNVDVDELIAMKTEIIIGHPSERNLVLQLQMFPDALAVTLEDLFPYHICEYLYNLSIAASDFVTQCKVLGSPEMQSRLLLCRATTMAMRECFDLLGIRHVDRI